MLLGLLSLPVLWWLLRLIPPQPRRIDFPPTRLLFDIKPKEETPRRTPWWLTLLRLTLATLVILAAAGPLWNPPVETATAKAPLALLIDDGFPAAGTWDARMRSADDLIARAETDNRGVALIPLSEPSRDISFETPAAARVRLKQIKPKPHAVERADMLVPLGRFLEATRDVELVWLSDGVDLGGGAEFVAALGAARRHAAGHRDRGRPAARARARRRRQHRRRAHRQGAALGERARPKSASCAGSISRACRSAKRPSRSRQNETETDAETHDPGRDQERHRAARNHRRALGRRGRAARQALAAARRSASSPARPSTPRSRCWPRPIISRARSVRSPTCGSPRRARPRRRSSQFIEQRLPMMILADVGNVAEAKDQLTRWIDDGGVLVRFAGPRLAASDDDLVPVKLRRGGRVLGGALSWEQPQQLAAVRRAKARSSAWRCRPT